MARCFRFVLKLIVVGAACAATNAIGYPTPVDFDGSILRWDVNPDSPPVTYHVDATRDGDDEIYGPMIDEAAALWSSVSGSFFRYERAEPGTTPQVTVYLQNAIDGGDYSAGYAIFDGYDGKTPTHCSIYVVVTGGESLSGLAKTFLHELGHCVGLGHSLIPEAIMSYQLDKNTFGLDIDDEAAVARLYPADGSAPKLPPGCAVGAGSTGLMIGLLLALPVILSAAKDLFAANQLLSTVTAAELADQADSLPAKSTDLMRA